jgi:predicted signal transduction protein with EAL and GGDEF domain
MPPATQLPSAQQGCPTPPHRRQLAFWQIWPEAHMLLAQQGWPEASAYAATGLTVIAFAILLSELGFNDRFKDHYLVAPQSTVCMLIAVAFTYIAPEAGGLFLCTLFIVFSFSSLRSTPGQTMVIWTAMTIGLTGLFLLTDKPVSIPHGSYLERFATLLVFVLTIGRCMFLGIFSSSMKQSLYQSGLKLKEAYKRIEELAELDELTGSYNRRCIMRMLDEEIARAGRNGSPCSIAPQPWGST